MGGEGKEMQSRSQGVATSKMNQMPRNNGVDKITYVQKKKTVTQNGIDVQESVVTSKKNRTPPVNHVDNITYVKKKLVMQNEISCQESVGTSKKNPTPPANHVDERPYVKPKRNYGMAKRKTPMDNDVDCQDAKRVKETIDDILPSQEQTSQQKIVDQQVLEVRRNQRADKKKREVQLINEEKQRKMQKIMEKERRAREYEKFRKEEKRNLPPGELDNLLEAEADLQAVRDELRIAQAVAAKKAERQTNNSKEKGIVKNLNNMFDIIPEPAGKSKSPQKVYDATVNMPVKMPMNANTLFRKQPKNKKLEEVQCTQRGDKVGFNTMRLNEQERKSIAVVTTDREGGDSTIRDEISKAAKTNKDISIPETPSKDTEMTLQAEEFVNGCNKHVRHREYEYFRNAMIVSPRAYQNLHVSEKVKCIPPKTSFTEYLTYHAYLKKYEDDQDPQTAYVFLTVR